MTLVSKLSLQLKKSNQASKALQHYYVHSFSSEGESWCHDEGKGRETETPVKQESLLARRLQLANHRETGGGWRGRRGGARDTSPDKENNQSSMDGRPPLNSCTNTQTDQGAIFSYRSEAD